GVGCRRHGALSRAAAGRRRVDDRSRRGLRTIGSARSRGRDLHTCVDGRPARRRGACEARRAQDADAGVQPMTARFANPWFLAVARGINAAFFLATAVYAILASSPFAYEQFIQPNVIAWLANFVFLHADYFWLALFVTLLSLAPYLQHARARIAAWSYLAASAILGIVMLFVPLLPAGNRFSQSVAVALASMIAIAWLAIIDFLNAPPRAGRSIEPASRLLATCLLTAVFVWAVYAAAAPFRLREAGGTVAPAALTLGVGASFVALLTIFTVVFLTARLAGRASTVLVAIALA